MLDILGYRESQCDSLCFLIEIYLHLSGLAESGLISSKLSRHDMQSSLDEDEGPFYFYPQR